MAAVHTGRTRGGRRRLVVTTFAAVVLCELIAAAALLGQLAPGTAAASALVPLVVAVAGGARMRGAARALAVHDSGAVDRTAFRVVATAWVVSLAYGALAGAVELPMPTRPGAFIVLMLVTLFFTLVLPSAIRLWTASDESRND